MRKLLRMGVSQAWGLVQRQYLHFEVSTNSGGGSKNAIWKLKNVMDKLGLDNTSSLCRDVRLFSKLEYYTFLRLCPIGLVSWRTFLEESFVSIGLQKKIAHWTFKVQKKNAWQPVIRGIYLTSIPVARRKWKTASRWDKIEINSALYQL